MMTTVVNSYDVRLHAELTSNAIHSRDRRDRTPAEHFEEEVAEFKNASTLSESIDEAGDVLFTMIKMMGDRYGHIDAGLLLEEVLRKNVSKLSRVSASSTI